MKYITAKASFKFMAISSFAGDHGRNDSMIRSFTRAEAVGMIFYQYEIASTVVQDDTSIISYDVGLAYNHFRIKHFPRKKNQ